MQYFFCKLVQMSNFGRLKSWALLDRLFPNLRQIHKIHPAYMVSIIEELQYHQKDLLSICSAFSVNWCKCPILVG